MFTGEIFKLNMMYWMEKNLSRKTAPEMHHSSIINASRSFNGWGIDVRRPTRGPKVSRPGPYLHFTVG
jgi:hypothetical protein